MGRVSVVLIACAVAVGVGFLISYGFKKQLFDILVAPLTQTMQTGDTLIYTNLGMGSALDRNFRALREWRAIQDQNFQRRIALC